MNIARRSLGIALVALIALGACAPVETLIVRKPGDASRASADGLVYRLPLQAILVTLTVTKDSRSVVISTTDFYPDMDHEFRAQYVSSQLAENSIQIGINENGLLQGPTTSVAKPRVDDILTGLAGALGTVNAFHSSNAVNPIQDRLNKLVQIPSATAGCTKIGSYTWIIEPVPTAWLDDAIAEKNKRQREAITPGADLARPYSRAQETAFELAAKNARMILCDVEVTVEQFPTESAGSGADSIHLGDSRAAGFFYRQARAYKVDVRDPRSAPAFPAQVSIFALPTRGSPIEFLPVAGAIVAKNEMDITFANGIPTSARQQVDSEWLGVVTIPADVIKAYFSAIGAVFQERANANSSEEKYLGGLYNLAKQQSQTQMCLAALKTGVPDNIAAACK